MFFLTAGLLYLGAACGFYSYLIGTAQILPEEQVEATMPARSEPAPAPQKQAA